MEALWKRQTAAERNRRPIAHGRSAGFAGKRAKAQQAMTASER
jgi:hypothetical protein